MQTEVFWATPRQPATLERLLVEDDRAHLGWLQNDRARAESATARALLRAALAARMRREPQDVPISRDCPDCGRPHGRPSTPNVYVSASHTDNRVAVAVSDVAEIGVDIETIHPTRFAGIRFDEGFERRARTEGERAAEWVRREAYLKCAGGTLPMDPALAIPTGGRALDLGPGYAAALYLDGDVRPPVTITAADDLLSAWAASPRTATA